MALILPGQHLSKQTEFKSGQVSWMKGRQHTSEAKEMMRLAKLGTKLSPDHKAKISTSNKGKSMSPEQRFKISTAHRGLKKPWAAETGRKQALKQLGENHPNWKGGTSRAYKTGYYSVEYKAWRRTVMIRDQFTCQNCGAKETWLTVHHIKSFAHYPDLRYDVDNGRTLCEYCHSLTDNYKTKGRKKRCAQFPSE